MLAVDHYPNRKTSWNAPTLKWKSHKPISYLAFRNRIQQLTPNKQNHTQNPKKTKRETKRRKKKKLDFKNTFRKQPKHCEKTKITKIQNFNQELENQTKLNLPN